MARRRGRRPRGRRRFMRRGSGRRKLLNGGMIRGRMHPPTNSASPWNNIVCTFQWNPTATDGKVFVPIQTLGAQQVRRQVKTELGIQSEIDIRVRRIDVWTQPQTSNSTRNTVVIAPCDWTQCGGAPINWYESWGTAVQPAHGHYVWPKSISTVVLPFGSDCTIVKFDVRDKNFAYIVKIHLMWRINAPNPLQQLGVLTSLRTHAMGNGGRPPSDDSDNDEDYCLVNQEPAISPLATVVEAFSLRS